MFLVLITAALWFSVAYSSPCKALPVQVSASISLFSGVLFWFRMRLLCQLPLWNCDGELPSSSRLMVWCASGNL